MTVLESCQSAGILDKVWGLPLGQDGGRDNIIHDTAVAIALEDPDDRKILWTATVKNFLQRAAVPKCPGVFYREAGNTSRNSYDNLIGTCVASALLDLPYADQVYQWGRHHEWCYNVEDPGHFAIQDCYVRFIGAPNLIKMSAGHSTLVGLWPISQAIEASLEPNNSDKTDVGNKLLMWLWKQALTGRSHYLDYWWKYWAKEMTKVYGNLDIFLGWYFKPVNGHPHPFVEASRGRGF